MAALDLAVTFLAGGVFGLALAAPPGPMNAIIAEESVLRGWTAGFRAGLGAMSADACFFALSLAGLVAALQSRPRLRATMIVVGGLLMWYFAIDAARNLRATVDAAGDPPTVDAPGRGFRRTFVLALTNPYQILFWLTVGVGLLEPGRLDALARTPYLGADLAGFVVVRTGSPAVVLGLFGGIAVWIVGFPAALVAGRRRVASVEPAVAGLAAIALAGFGTVFLFEGLRTLS